ncbi:MAG: FHA domain-containing protein [Coriobacteriia bacterium]|nr:FHA domain-containing protein [Coriobacteriia bacterium]
MTVCKVCGFDYTGEKCPRCAVLTEQSTTTFTPVNVADSLVRETVETSAGMELCVVKGPQMGDCFSINDANISIGRDTNADIFLNDRTVSREHSEIVSVGDVVILRDLGSLNGTYLDGVLIDEAELKSGSIIQIGTFQMQFLKG